MILLPKVSSWRRLPLRNPSPTPARSKSDPTPQAMPNMVRNERSLCAHRVRKVWPKISRSVRTGWLGPGRDRSRRYGIRLRTAGMVSRGYVEKARPVSKMLRAGDPQDKKSVHLAEDLVLTHTTKRPPSSGLLIDRKSTRLFRCGRKQDRFRKCCGRATLRTKRVCT